MARNRSGEKGRLSGLRLSPSQPGGVIVRKRPVNEIGVDVIELQILQRLRKGEQNVPAPMHIVPYLAGDKQLLAADSAFLKSLPEHLADLLFVAVHGGAVEQAIAAADRAGYGAADLFSGKPVAAEGSHADAGHFLSRAQAHLRDALGIDSFSHIPLSFI